MSFCRKYYVEWWEDRKVEYIEPTSVIREKDFMNPDPGRRKKRGRCVAPKRINEDTSVVYSIGNVIFHKGRISRPLS